MNLTGPTKALWTTDNDATMASMRAEGRTAREIGTALGRTVTAVRRRGELLRALSAAAAPPPEPAAPPDPEPAPAVPEAAAPDDAPPDRARRPAWRPEEDALLVDMRRQGLPDEDIATALGRSVAAVHTRAWTLRHKGDAHDVPSRKRPAPLTAAQVDEVRELHARGLTTHQIATRVGTYATAVGRVLRPGRRDDEPDHVRTAAAVEEARAALARAEVRHREAIDPVLAAVRAAVLKAGFVDGPDGDDGDGVWPSPEWLVLDHLRTQGLELRRVS